MDNPCVRCGKPRIEVKSWKEKIGISFITYSITVCPDTECQEIIDRETAERKKKAEKNAKDRERAKLERVRLIAANKLTS